MMAISDRAARKPEKVRGKWIKRSILIFLCATALVVAGLIMVSQTTPFAVLAEKTAYFSSVMRVVRPIVLIAVLMLWRPVFLWLHQRAWVEISTYQKAIKIWPRLAIWAGLVELTLGQGHVLLGLAATIAYSFYIQSKEDDDHDC